MIGSPCASTANTASIAVTNRSSNPDCREEYQNPFKDFPPMQLARSTPEEAAKFAARYAAGYILKSSVLEKISARLPVSACQEIDNKINEVRGEVTGYDDEIFGLQRFLDVTDKATRFRVGNCGELCAVGARSLMEFGYPGEVDVMAISGKAANGAEANHSFLVINGTEGQDAWVADPLTAMMEPDLRESLLGDKEKDYIALKKEALKIIPVYLERDGEISCHPFEIMEKEAGMNVRYCYKVSLKEGNITLSHP